MQFLPVADTADADADSKDDWTTPWDVITHWQTSPDCCSSLNLSCTWLLVTSSSPNYNYPPQTKKNKKWLKYENEYLLLLLLLPQLQNFTTISTIITTTTLFIFCLN